MPVENIKKNGKQQRNGKGGNGEIRFVCSKKLAII
jgi:hypothetical protein